MFCPKCGKELKEGAKFCASCGAQVGDAPAAGSVAGGGNAAPAVGNVAAAAPMAGGAAGAPAAPAPAKRKKPIALAAAGVAVVAVVVIGFFAYNALFPSYEINEERFPDAAFRSYVSAKFDTNGDGKLSHDEITAVEYMGTLNTETSTYDGGLNSLNIANLSGIETFSNLKGIYASNNPLTDVDLSSNGALEWVVMDCDSLKYLNVTGTNNLQAVQVDPATEVKGLDDSMVKNSLVKSATDESGNTDTLLYDAAGHLLGNDGRTFTWDGDKLVNVNNCYPLSYDEDGRLVDAEGTSISYDDEGKVTAVSGCSYSYDDAGRLASVTNGSGTLLTVSYNDNGLPTSIEGSGKFGDGKRTCTFGYDDSGNLVTIADREEGFAGDYTYTYDDNGKLTSSTYTSKFDSDNYSSNSSYTYSYNEKGQLASVQQKYSTDTRDYNNYTYSYDDSGNLLSVSESYSDLLSGGVVKKGTHNDTYTYVDVYVPREIDVESYAALYDGVSDTQQMFYGTDIPKAMSGTFTSADVLFTDDYIDVVFAAPTGFIEFATGQTLPFAN